MAGKCLKADYSATASRVLQAGQKSKAFEWIEGPRAQVLSRVLCLDPYFQERFRHRPVRQLSCVTGTIAAGSLMLGSPFSMWPA